jgi:hypothetical protein
MIPTQSADILILSGEYDFLLEIVHSGGVVLSDWHLNRRLMANYLHGKGLVEIRIGWVTSTPLGVRASRSRRHVVAGGAAVIVSVQSPQDSGAEF